MNELRLPDLFDLDATPTIRVDISDDDKADAKYKDGVLYLTLPKRAQASQKRLSIS